MLKEMLSVLMDGIKDSDMLLEYMEEAEDVGNMVWAEWFKNHAVKRIQEVESDYEYIIRNSDMNARISEHDEIACALKEYLSKQVKTLGDRI